MYKSFDKKIVFSTPFFEIQENKLLSSTGEETSPWYRFIVNDFVIIVPITVDGDVVMVRQYRNGSESMSLELPAGGLEDGEDFESAAHRELCEETGYECPRLIQIGQEMSSNPATHSSRCRVFLGEGAVKKYDQRLDEYEDIQVVLLPFNQVVASLFSGEIISVATSYAILGAAAKRSQLFFSSGERSIR